VAGIPRPRPCFLDTLVNLGFKNGELRWARSDKKRLYTWDSLHGEIEVFNKRGIHIGVIDAMSGVQIKEAVKGRTIDVS